MPLVDWALVVGINRYPGLLKDDGTENRLDGAENDARAFFRWVTTTGGASKAKMILSSDFGPPTGPQDARPIRDEVEKFFEDLIPASKANNNAMLGNKAGRRIWLFFSGHGFSPTLDRSGVLMANATQDFLYNIGAHSWANRLYEGGWFDEVVLFQDACRERVTEADVMPPSLRGRQAPGGQIRRRFYAFAAREGKLAIEKRDETGTVHGVFTATLMAGLTGAAREPATQAITAAQLKGYLESNMGVRLTDAERSNSDFAQEPAVDPSDPFVIVPPPPAAAPSPPAAAKFPVRITFAHPGGPARIEDVKLQSVESVDAAPPVWEYELPRGFYRVVAGEPGEPFQVTGALMEDGSRKRVDVSVP
jgi:hypothetical protein